MEPLQIAEIIQGKFPDSVLSTGEYNGQAWVTIEKSALIEICKYLKSDAHMGFNYMRDLTAVDYLGKRDARFEMVYHLFSIRHRHMIRIKAAVQESDCSIDSITAIWSGANWHERECFDLFGISFNGHPDHRRILMPDDWEGHPLRKDYPVKGPELKHDWQGFKEVIEKAEKFKEFEWNR